MTPASTFIEKQGEHSADIKNLKSDVNNLYDITRPLATTVEVIVRETNKLVERHEKTAELALELDKRHAECKAAREALATAEGSKMSRMQYIVAWTIILGFAGTVITAGVGGVYWLLKNRAVVDHIK